VRRTGRLRSAGRSAAALGAVLVTCVALGPTARAQFGARATVEPPITAGSDQDPTASATAVELEGRPRALETVDEVLLEVPGARSRRTGAFGGFTSLSLRGAEAEHTTVLLGEVPLTSADGSAFDLSTIPPWLFERLEVFRGGAPIWLGAGAIGGVLRLVPRRARGTSVEAVAGAGSFGLAQGRAAMAVDRRDISTSAVAGATSSGGAFPFVVDPNPLVPGGEVERTQTNAQLLEGAGMGHLRARVAGGTFSVVAMGLERSGGLALPVGRWRPDSVARRTHVRALVAASAEWLESGRPPEQADLAAWRVQLVASAGLERRTVSDPFAQFGLLPRESDQTLHRASLRAAGSVRMMPGLDATLVAAGWHEGFDPRDVLATRPLSGSRRLGGSAALEARVHGRAGDLRWELRPSARVEGLQSDIAEVRAERPDRRTSTLRAMPTARLGAVIEPWPGIAVQASGATGTRSPSFLELFGDGGFLLGNTALRPEQSHTVDLGVTLRGAEGELRGLVELRGFGLVLTDLIRPRRVETNQVILENVASAWTAGLEASVRLAVGRGFTLTSALTWIESRDTTLDRALPYRPAVTAYVRPALVLPAALGLDGASVYADLEAATSAYQTPENDLSSDGLLRVGAGISLEAVRRVVRLDLVVRDLFDARGRDFLDRPLPGRSLALQLAVRTD